MKFPYLIQSLDFKLIIGPILVYLIGLLTIVSSAPSLFWDHFIYFMVGMLLFFFLNQIDFQIFTKYSFQLYIIVLCLLVVTYIIGHTALGAVRWLRIGELTVQPSELSKVVVTFLMAKILTSQNYFKSMKLKFLPSRTLKVIQNTVSNRFIQSFLLFIPIFVLVIAQPDLGTSLSILFIYINLILFSNFSKKIVLIIAIFIGILSQPLWNSLKPYQKERVLIFINPEKDRYGAGYNSIQATIAVGSGGIFGKGFQKGTQTQLNFLPIYWTDFLVATYAEEWGFIGLLFLISVYLYFIYYSLSKLKTCQNDELKLAGVGAISYFTFQFLINFGMNIGIFPVTGIPLPFFSYGGTSLISSFIFLYILNKVSTHQKI